ncbi:MAG: P1 family peptidase [Bryobacterales bacterium]
MTYSFSRRSLLASAIGAPLYTAMANAKPKRTPQGSLTDVPGLKVGHFTHTKRPTGCTVVLAEAGSTAGADVRGGAPGTRDIELLRPEMSVQQVHAIVLSGGSAYGLATADGVMRYLEERGIGFPIGGGVVPIVPAAIILDFGVGGMTPRPDAASGYSAAKAATGEPFAQGNVGAGAGATVGKMFGRQRAMKGGLGSASLKLPGGLVIGALAAVNCIGDVVDPDNGELLAGARTPDGKKLLGAMDELRRGATLNATKAGENTTIAIVAVNVEWIKAEATKVAQMAHDGLARAIRPSHMPMDGDTVFALGTGGASLGDRLGTIGALAADVLAQAVVSAVLHAESVEGFVAYRDLEPR